MKYDFAGRPYPLRLSVVRDRRLRLAAFRGGTVVGVLLLTMSAALLSSCSGGGALSGPSLKTARLGGLLSAMGNLSVNTTVSAGSGPSLELTSLQGRAVGRYDLSTDTGSFVVNGLGLPTGSPATLLLTPAGVYFKMAPALTAGLVAQKEWVGVAFSQVVGTGTEQAGLVVGAELLDPGIMVEMIKHGIAVLRKSATRVNGLSEYAGTLDLRSLAEKDGCLSGAAAVPNAPAPQGFPGGMAVIRSGCVESALTNLEVTYSGSFTVPVDVMVRDGHVASISADMDPASTWGQGGGSGRMPEATTVTTSFSAARSRGHVVPPPPRDVTGLSGAYLNSSAGIIPMTLSP